MVYKKYEIEYYDNENCLNYIKLSIKDLSDFFYQIKGFPTVLSLGKLSGEGQSGGRFITEIAKELEKEIVRDIEKEKYIQTMDKLRGK